MGIWRFIKIMYKRYFERLEFYDSYERDILISLIDIKPGERVLDLGFGIGNLLRRIVRKGAKGFGIDILERNIEMGRIYNPFSKYVLCSADNLLFEDKFFDKVVSTSSLEHMDNLQKVFYEVNRVLKNKGKFIFSMDVFENENIDKGFKENYFKSRGIIGISSEEVETMLKKSKFSILNKRYLYCSNLGSGLEIFGIKLSEHRILRILSVPLLSIFAYPTIKLLDNLNKNKKGNVLIIRVIKNGI